MLQQNAAQIAGLEKERDFYYQKLRDVEVICQEPECETSTHVQKILEILYATEVCRQWDIFFSFQWNFVKWYSFWKEGFEIPDESDEQTNFEQEF